jgi:phosphopantothenoylcysteine decarboxylase/phosphopantothenate--cysteine ligase
MDAKKRAIIGVCGGIAAYKCNELASLMVQDGIDVHVIITKAGQNFVAPLTFQAITKNPVHTEMFELTPDAKIGHVALADQADLIIIAPATADIIAKIACGICDDLLTTTICASTAKKLLAPSMNAKMWENPITQDNVKRLSKLEYEFVGPVAGMLACGYEGMGRMSEPEEIMQRAKTILNHR